MTTPAVRVGGRSDARAQMETFGDSAALVERRIQIGEAGRTVTLLAFVAGNLAGRCVVRFDGAQSATVRRVNPDIPEVAGLEVADSFHGRGVATALIHGAARLASRRAVDRIGLGVPQSDSRALARLRTLGFEGTLGYDDAGIVLARTGKATIHPAVWVTASSKALR